jgi:mannitol/fructose-specific phosphotransferase system IIA component (Ntr-type)
LVATRVNDRLALAPVIVHDPWNGFDDAVRGLVTELVAADHLAEALADRAAHAVIEREAMASTALIEIGVSIPHARLPGVNGIVAALAVSPAAVYYAHAQVPITIMTLVLSSPSLSNEHLNFLSALSLLLQSEATRGALRNTATAAQLFEYVSAQERFR